MKCFWLKLNLVSMWKPIWSLRIIGIKQRESLTFIESVGWLHFLWNREVKENFEKISQAAAYWNHQSAFIFLWVFVLDGRKTQHILKPKWQNRSIANDSQTTVHFMQ